MSTVAAGHWTWTDEAEECQVELKQTSLSFSLSSDGCRETYCGARAYLEATFPISGRIGAPKGSTPATRSKNSKL